MAAKLNASKSNKLLGLFANEEMFQQREEGKGDEYDPVVPLPDMTRKALVNKMIGKAIVQFEAVRQETERIKPESELATLIEVKNFGRAGSIAPMATP